MTIIRKHKMAEAVGALCNGRQRTTEKVALGALAILSVCGGIAQAQDNATGAEEITVTGSRLRRDGMTSPTPVTAVEMTEVRAMAPTLLMDSLNQLPQFRDNDQSQTGSIFTSSGGSNSVNLRGIGSNRTLTLLDGRRMVPGQQAGTVDIAILPTSLIQRVEVVTGGASAAYGSDAISGVTNFILDTNFTGAKADVQAGSTSRSDHRNYQVEFAAGSDIGEKGHIVASMDYYNADGMLGMNGRGWGLRDWAMFTRGVNAQPRRFYAPGGQSRVTAPGGMIPSGPLGGTIFVDGQPTALINGTEVVGTAQVGGNNGNSLNEDWTSLRPADERNSAFLHYKYDFTSDKTAYVQILHGEHAVTGMPAPIGFAPGWGLTLYNDNPYLPQSIVDRMAAANVTSVPFNRVYEDIAPSRLVRDTTRTTTIGFDGKVGERLYLSAYYQQGENIEYANYSQNGLLVRTDRFYRALDSAIDPATGRIACRANLAIYGGLTPEQEALVTKVNAQGRTVSADPESNRQCVPMDPFATHLPQNVLDYVTEGDPYHRQQLQQNIFDMTLQTDIGQTRRAGSISVGGGVSYRDENVYQDAGGSADDPRRFQDFGVFSSYNNPADQIPIRGLPGFVRDRGVYFTGNPNSQGPIQGAFKVWEAYGESIIPIIKNDNGGGVELHLAARYADYTGSGGVWAWKFGGDWRINQQVRFRGTVSRDTRAGTLSERFDTQGAGANITQGQDPVLPNETYIAGLTTGGNPNIRPELADTTTVGVVYQPQWAEDLNLSIDFYDIKIQDAIAQLGTQEILDRCYLQGAQDICALIKRNDTGTPYILQIYNVFINIAETVTRGVDIEASYRKRMKIFGGNESVTFRFFANYLDEVSSAFVGVAPLNQAGELAYPKWLLTGSFTYSNGPFHFNWQTRYRESTIRNLLYTEGTDIENNHVSGRTYTNLNLSYDLDWGKTSGQLYFYVGNLFDKDPPLVPGGVSGTTSMASYTDNGRFETLGRNYNLGLQFKF